MCDTVPQSVNAIEFIIQKRIVILEFGRGLWLLWKYFKENASGRAEMRS